MTNDPSLLLGAIALGILTFASFGIYEARRVARDVRASYVDASNVEGKPAMRMLILQEADITQIQAILNTHAEMQDARINDIGPIIARLRGIESRDEAEDDMILDLEAQLIVFEEDAEDLKRISNLLN